MHTQLGIVCPPSTCPLILPSATNGANRILDKHILDEDDISVLREERITLIRRILIENMKYLEVNEHIYHKSKKESAMKSSIVSITNYNNNVI